MQRYTVYLYLETALHVSGGTSTPSSGAHTTVSTASGICHTVTAICCYRGKVGTGLSVLCCVVGGVGHLQHNTAHSNQFQLFHDSSNGVTNTRCCWYSCLRSWLWVRVPPETCRAVSRKINCVTLHLVGCILQYYNSFTLVHVLK